MNRFSKYLDTLSHTNDLGKGRDIRWIFHGGMLFSSPDKWWGDFKRRASVHEGMDITYYSDSKGNIYQFDDSIRVPAMESGIVLNVCDDFLGSSIIIEPFREASLENFRILYVYAHTTPMSQVLNGAVIMENEVIAQVCKTIKNPQLPPHLHFSCFEVPRALAPEMLSWQLFSKSKDIRLIHPLFL